MTTEPLGPTPQDAPAGQPWPPTERQPSAAVAPPQRRVIAAPQGPNWVLATVGVLLMLAAGASIAYLLGYRADGTFRFGPQALIALGALLVLVGIVGSLIRSRSCGSSRRREAATRRGSDATSP